MNISYCSILKAKAFYFKSCLKLLQLQEKRNHYLFQIWLQHNLLWPQQKHFRLWKNTPRTSPVIFFKYTAQRIVAKFELMNCPSFKSHFLNLLLLYENILLSGKWVITSFCPIVEIFSYCQLLLTKNHVDKALVIKFEYATISWQNWNLSPLFKQVLLLRNYAIIAMVKHSTLDKIL